MLTSKIHENEGSITFTDNDNDNINEVVKNITNFKK